MRDLPSKHFDLVLERVLFTLERRLVDDFDGEELPGFCFRLGEPNLRESASVVSNMQGDKKKELKLDHGTKIGDDT